MYETETAPPEVGAVTVIFAFGNSVVFELEAVTVKALKLAVSSVSAMVTESGPTIEPPQT